MISQCSLRGSEKKFQSPNIDVIRQKSFRFTILMKD